MSVSVAEVVPPTTTFTYRGQTYVLPPATINHFAAILQRMREQVPDPMPRLVPTLASLPEQLALSIFREAHDKHQAALAIPIEAAIQHAVSTHSGLAYLLWLLLHEKHPMQFSEAELFAHVTDLELSAPPAYIDLIERILTCSGLKFLGESLARELRKVADARAKIGPPRSGDSANPLSSAAADSTPPPSGD